MITSATLPLRYILKKIKFELIYVIVIGLTVHYLAKRFDNYLPEMPIYVPAFLGTAISILLSFKMSQSYDRWWEARKAWGAIVNDSRVFVMQIRFFLMVKDGDKLLKKLAYRQIAWCYSLGQYLRGQDALKDTEGLLSAEDLIKLRQCKNIPLAILQMNADTIHLLRQKDEIDVMTYIQLDNTFIRLLNSMGKSERINSTVFPTTYRIFLHFSIYLFVTILSIALQDIKVYLELPLLVAISSVFLLLEKSSTHLEDPFKNRPNDIPVTDIAKKIETDIKQLLNETTIEEPALKKNFYIL